MSTYLLQGLLCLGLEYEGAITHPILWAGGRTLVSILNQVLDLFTKCYEAAASPPWILIRKTKSNGRLIKEKDFLLYRSLEIKEHSNQTNQYLSIWGKVAFFTVGSWEKDTNFSAAKIFFGPSILWQHNQTWA